MSCLNRSSRPLSADRDGGFGGRCAPPVGEPVAECDEWRLDQAPSETRYDAADCKRSEPPDFAQPVRQKVELRTEPPSIVQDEVGGRAGLGQQCQGVQILPERDGIGML